MLAGQGALNGPLALQQPIHRQVTVFFVFRCAEINEVGI